GHACARPFHERANVSAGGPHGATAAAADVDGGRMDGFIHEQRRGRRVSCPNVNSPACTAAVTGRPDVMGYHDERDLPNYWAYASNFVLQDHMFEPNASWSLPAHLFLVSEWSASCTQHNDPSSCVNALQTTRRDRPPDYPAVYGGATRNTPIFAWTDLTYLLHRSHVSWGYYVV